MSLSLILPGCELGGEEEEELIGEEEYIEQEEGVVGDEELIEEARDIEVRRLTPWFKLPSCRHPEYSPDPRTREG